MLVPNVGYKKDMRFVLSRLDAIGIMLESTPESKSLQVGIDMCIRCPDQHKLASPMRSTI